MIVIKKIEVVVVVNHHYIVYVSNVKIVKN
jgi:hypothetical protein